MLLNRIKRRRHQLLISLFTLVCGLLLFLSSLAPSRAIPVSEVLNPRQNNNWVTDMADLLSPDSETKLNQMITALEEKNGAEIAVVTVPDTKPSASPKAFATELFNTWGIGKKGVDNGILFLVSKYERRTEIETGYGLESILPDAKVGNILRTQVTPHFKQGNFDAGIVNGTQAIIQVLEGGTIASQAPLPEESLQPSTSLTKRGKPVFWLGYLAVITAVVVTVMGILKYVNQRKTQVYRISPRGRTTLASHIWVSLWIKNLRKLSLDDCRQRPIQHGVALNSITVFKTWWACYGVSAGLLLMADSMDFEVVWWLIFALFTWGWLMYELWCCFRRDVSSTKASYDLFMLNVFIFLFIGGGFFFIGLINPSIPRVLMLPFLSFFPCVLRGMRLLPPSGTVFINAWLLMMIGGILFIYPFLSILLILPFLYACAGALRSMRLLSQKKTICQCQSCGDAMQWIDEDCLRHNLEASLFSNRFECHEGWQCLTCGPSTVHMFSEHFPLITHRYSDKWSKIGYRSSHSHSSGGSDFGGGSSGGGGAGESW